MKIILAGAGSVGSTICRQLVREGHAITVIDIDSDLLDDLSRSADVICVAGNAADVSVLKSAGAQTADLLLAVTPNDEVNILCCAAARKLGTKDTVARIRRPEYGELTALLRGETNLSMSINPELAAARDIYRLLRYPFADHVEIFLKGRVEMAELTLKGDSPLVGKTLNELRMQIPVRFLICCVLRAEETFIPSGNFTLNEGDVVCVSVAEKEAEKFFRAAGVSLKPIRRVMIAGAGRTAEYLLPMLTRAHIDVTVFERESARSVALKEQNPDCLVYRARGTEEDLLKEEKADGVDAYLTLSENDEENAIVSLFAKSYGFPKNVTLISAVSSLEFFRAAGLECVVSPKTSAAESVVRYVRSKVTASEIEALHTIMDGRAEVLEFSVRQEISGLTDIELKKLALKPGCLIACLLRDNEIIVPSGNDCVRVGDAVVVVTEHQGLDNLRGLLK